MKDKEPNTICPNCSHEFHYDETFGWDLDENGHPTIENIYCPRCGIGTRAMWTCDMCPLKFKCDLLEKDEMCKCCDVFVSCSDFTEIDNSNETTEEKES